jgi:hypothetical protein
MPSRRDEYDEWLAWVRGQGRRHGQGVSGPSVCQKCRCSSETTDYAIRWDEWSNQWLCNRCWAGVAPKYRIPRFDGWE